MSNPGTTPGQNFKNQNNYDRDQQSKRNEYPDKSQYIPKQRRDQDNEGRYVEKSEGTKDPQDQSDRVRRPYKDNKSNYDANYSNNYGRGQNSYNRSENEGKGDHGDGNYYGRKYENRTGGYQHNYQGDNTNQRGYQGERRGGYNKNWQNSDQEGEYRKRDYQNDRKPYNKQQNGDNVGNKNNAENKTADQENKAAQQQPNKTNQAASTTEQPKSTQVQQKQDTTSQAVSKPVTTQSASSQPAEVKKENIPSTTSAPQSQSVSVQPQIQAVSAVNYVQGPVGTEQNRLHFAPGAPQVAQMPMLFQVPYIVFPQPNGISIVQPLYQVPTTGSGDKTGTYSLPANLVPSTDTTSKQAAQPIQMNPQFFGYPQMQSGFLMNPLMGSSPMMQPFYFSPQANTGNVASETQEKKI